jgi:hypothetical protein
LAGWIKLHRKIINSTVFDNEKLLKVWIWCLLKATHDEYEQLVGRQIVNLQKGQFVTGRNAASKELKMTPSTTWDYLKVLERNQNIDIKSNNKYSIVTIVNWELYQSENEISDNKSTTNQQQINTNKNIKNNKNISIYSIFDSYSDNADLRQALRDYSQMRNKIKAPLTERAVTLLLNKLDALASTDDLKIKLLENATLSNWKSVYPLKEEKQQQKQKPNKFHNFIQNDKQDLDVLAEQRRQQIFEKLKNKEK